MTLVLSLLVLFATTLPQLRDCAPYIPLSGQYAASSIVYRFAPNPPNARGDFDAPTAMTGIDLLAVRFAISPCSVIAPHVHPRANEFIVAITGTVQTTVIFENGTVFTATLKRGDISTVPIGLVHFYENASCQNATTYNILDAANGGIVFIGQMTGLLPVGIQPSFFSGLLPSPNTNGSMLFGVDAACLARCAAAKKRAAAK